MTFLNDTERAAWYQCVIERLKLSSRTGDAFAIADKMLEAGHCHEANPIDDNTVTNQQQYGDEDPGQVLDQLNSSQAKPTTVHGERERLTRLSRAVLSEVSSDDYGTVVALFNAAIEALPPDAAPEPSQRERLEKLLNRISSLPIGPAARPQVMSAFNAAIAACPPDDQPPHKPSQRGALERLRKRVKYWIDQRQDLLPVATNIYLSETLHFIDEEIEWEPPDDRAEVERLIAAARKVQRYKTTAQDLEALGEALDAVDRVRGDGK